MNVPSIPQKDGLPVLGIAGFPVHNADRSTIRWQTHEPNVAVVEVGSDPAVAGALLRVEHP
jgi:hypothetical protein